MAIHLSSGSRIKDYVLTTDMTSSDAGTSMWAFAEKGGFDFFVKCYLTPVFPDPRGPGSEHSKSRKRARCEAFESRMNSVESTLKQCGDENFLVRGVDFFRHDGVYFKITKRIYSTRLKVSELPAKKQMLVLLSAAFALRALHENSSFIHADIKPENFMLQRAGAGLIANLIDFDSGFYMGHPPEAEELLGDQRYWAPELIAWLGQESRTPGRRRPALLQSLDIFSLGLTFCEYLSGALPGHPAHYAYPGEAVLDEAGLQIPEPAWPDLASLRTLLRAMLRKDPLRRPHAAEVHERLRALNKTHFVRDTTYRRVANSLKKSLISGGESMRDRAKTRFSKPASRSGSELQLRGLKAGPPAEPGSIVERLGIRSKR